MGTQRTKVFISYSHQDKKWLERLQVHLKPLEREGLDVWDDTRIKAGAKWRKEIEQALAQAKVAVLLVSADFLASDFIHDNELPPLLEAAEKGGATILPLIVAPSLYTETPSLARFQAMNQPDKPLSGLSKAKKEDVLVEAAKAILAALGKTPSTTPLAKAEARRRQPAPNRPAALAPERQVSGSPPAFRSWVFGGITLLLLVLALVWWLSQPGPVSQDPASKPPAPANISTGSASVGTGIANTGTQTFQGPVNIGSGPVTEKP